MLLFPRSQVWPSGALRATASAARLPPAPGRFSITACWPQRSASFCPRARARMSLGPPGVKPMTKRTGLPGNEIGCAPQSGAARASSKYAASFLALLRGADLIEHWPQITEKCLGVFAHGEMAETFHHSEFRSLHRRCDGPGIARRGGVIVLAGEEVERAQSSVDAAKTAADVAF